MPRLYFLQSNINNDDLWEVRMRARYRKISPVIPHPSNVLQRPKTLAKINGFPGLTMKHFNGKFGDSSCFGF